MAPQDRPARRAARDGGVDEEGRPEGQDEGAREPRDARPPDDGQGGDDGVGPRAEDGGEEDGEDQLGEREDDVDQSHHDAVHDAALIARHHPEGDPDGQRDGEHGKRDAERYLGADDEAAQRVPPEVVGPHGVDDRGRAPDGEEVGVPDTVGREGLREERHQDDDGDDGRPDDGVPAPPEAQGEVGGQHGPDPPGEPHPSPRPRRMRGSTQPYRRSTTRLIPA